VFSQPITRQPDGVHIMSALFVGPDGQPRCPWCASTPEYVHYHDHEWGMPVSDDIRLFEKISLEGIQSGLSWRTILSKRANFRRAFLGFDFNELVHFGEADVERLLQDEGIVRHRGKIEAVIHNAGRAQALVSEAGSLAAFFWRFEPTVAALPAPQAVTTTPEATRLSKELKRRGWKFVGPTTVYAFMQAMGLVNDHAQGCAFRTHAERARQVFARPAGIEPATPAFGAPFPTARDTENLAKSTI
jgi:DNA-3-methyladenine glycosylase I